MAAMMLQWFLFSLMLAVTAGVAKNGNQSSLLSSGTKMPKLFDSWSSFATIATINSSFQPVEAQKSANVYADWKVKKISMFMDPSSPFSQDIYDYNNGGRKIMIRGKTCSVQKGSFNPFGPFIPITNAPLQMEDLFYFGVKYNSNYSGIETILGTRYEYLTRP